jgi:hypothetical protein
MARHDRAPFGADMIDDELLLVVAKALQWTHSKATLGEPRKWGQLSDDEQRLWLRMARQAAAKMEERLEPSSPVERMAGGPAGGDVRAPEARVLSGETASATSGRSQGPSQTEPRDTAKPEPPVSHSKSEDASKPKQPAGSSAATPPASTRLSGSSWTDLLRRKPSR